VNNISHISIAKNFNFNLFRYFCIILHYFYRIFTISWKFYISNFIFQILFQHKDTRIRWKSKLWNKKNMYFNHKILLVLRVKFFKISKVTKIKKLDFRRSRMTRRSENWLRHEDGGGMDRAVAASPATTAFRSKFDPFFGSWPTSSWHLAIGRS